MRSGWWWRRGGRRTRKCAWPPRLRNKSWQAAGGRRSGEGGRGSGGELIPRRGTRARLHTNLPVVRPIVRPIVRCRHVSDNHKKQHKQTKNNNNNGLHTSHQLHAPNKSKGGAFMIGMTQICLGILCHSKTNMVTDTKAAGPKTTNKTVSQRTGMTSTPEVNQHQSLHLMTASVIQDPEKGTQTEHHKRVRGKGTKTTHVLNVESKSHGAGSTYTSSSYRPSPGCARGLIQVHGALLHRSSPECVSVKKWPQNQKGKNRPNDNESLSNNQQTPNTAAKTSHITV